MDDKEANYLAKSFLELLEDLQEEHSKAFYKLEYLMKDLQSDIEAKHGQSIPLSSFIRQADYFDDDRFNLIRKRVLDKANDLKRRSYSNN
jgi:hypothetical protein